MSKINLFILIGGSVVFYDALASFLSKVLHFEYTDFAIGSVLIYFLSGSLVAWRFCFFTGFAAAVFAGFIDATLGLFISEMIGPTTAHSIEFVSFHEYFFVFASVVLGSAIIGLVGAVVGILIKRMIPKATNDGV